MYLRSILLFVLLLGAAQADTIRVAVAANFKAPVDALAEVFTETHGHDLLVSTGSTGQLHAQITHGAPFDVFLSADQDRPLALIEAGLAEPGSLRTYAYGRLSAIARDPALLSPTGPQFSRFRTLSIANPRTAPYGAAALQVLEALGAPGWIRIAQAQSIAGVNAAVRAGAAEVGFAALSTVLLAGDTPYWPVPADLHDPIRQDAVLLRRAADKRAARMFLDWLVGDEARQLILRHGYGID